MATSDAPLKVPDVTIGLARAVGGGGGGTSPEPTILYDGFESADMSAPDGPAPAKNTSGFSWGNNNKTSVVTRNEDGNVAVYNNSPIYSIKTAPIEEQDYTAKTGDYCLRAIYTAMPGGELTEQRFNLGTTIFPEIWMSFWLRVPLNFYHGGGSTERNHKIFRLWQDDYAVIPEKIGMEFRGDGNGNSYFYIWPGSGNGPENDPSFINRATDLGKWMHLVVQGRIESTPGAQDGLVRVWRKWEDEPSHTQTHERLNMDFQRSTTAGKEGFTVGYLMGWHNGGYAEDTEWFIDDVCFSETSLVEE